MTRTSYNDVAAAAFQASRELPPDALGQWRAAIGRYLAPRPGMRVLDAGAGTGPVVDTLDLLVLRAGQEGCAPDPPGGR